MSEIEIGGQDGPELRAAMDATMSLITEIADVQGAMLLVFTNDLDAPSGTSVSLQARGILPSDEELAKIVSGLLTAAHKRRESPDQS